MSRTSDLDLVLILDIEFNFFARKCSDSTTNGVSKDTSLATKPGRTYLMSISAGRLAKNLEDLGAEMVG